MLRFLSYARQNRVDDGRLKVLMSGVGGNRVLECGDLIVLDHSLS